MIKGELTIGELNNHYKKTGQVCRCYKGKVYIKTEYLFK